MDEQIKSKIQGLIDSAKVFLFMKGTPQQPACGFSANTIAILQKANITFSSYDILEDPVLRQALKEFSNWPTYPQLYVDGKLIGGNDIITEMAESGELQKLLN